MTTNIDHNQLDEGEPSLQLEESNKNIEQKPKHHGNPLIIHYTHENRFESLKRDMHQVYDNVFKNTTIDDIQLIVGNRNC